MIESEPEKVTCLIIQTDAAPKVLPPRVRRRRALSRLSFGLDNLLIFYGSRADSGVRLNWSNVLAYPFACILILLSPLLVVALLLISWYRWPARMRFSLAQSWRRRT